MDGKLLVAVLISAALLLFGCAANAYVPQQNSSAQAGAQQSPPLPPAANASAAAVAQQAGKGTGASPPAPPAQQGANAAAPAVLTMGDVARHNTQADCWMAISGAVYDLTSFSNHPGGTAYVPFCGTDATNAFATKGGTGGSHSSTALAMLPNYRIGYVGQPATSPSAPSPQNATGSNGRGGDDGDDGEGWDD